MRNAAERVLATIFDATIAKRSQFLYTIYGVLENHATLYVGQTRAKAGPLHRLTQHLSDTYGNTYLQRLSDLYHYEEVPLEKVEFVAVRFTPARMYQIESPAYREAVENLVQRSLLNWVTDQKLKITIVSRTRGNAYNKLQDIQAEADRIYGDLKSWILKCYQ